MKKRALSLVMAAVVASTMFLEFPQFYPQSPVL